MDDKELDSILESKFASMRTPMSAPSLVPEVMQRVAQVSTVSTHLTKTRRFEWLLVLGWLLGAVVCFSSLQGLELASLLEGVSFAGFGAYEQTATQVALVLAAVGVSSPMLYVVMQD